MGSFVDKLRKSEFGGIHFDDNKPCFIKKLTYLKLGSIAVKYIDGKTEVKFAEQFLNLNSYVTPVVYSNQGEKLPMCDEADYSTPGELPDKITLTSNDKQIADKTESICLMFVRGDDANDEPVYAYLSVRTSIIDLFYNDLVAGELELTKYTHVLQTGPNMPDTDMVDDMYIKYLIAFDKTHVRVIPT